MVLQSLLTISPANSTSEKTGTEYRFDIAVVDDGSRDNTSELVTSYPENKQIKIHLIRHPSNLGVGAAIRSGINFGIQNKYDYGIVVSGDFQHRAVDVQTVLEKLSEEDLDFVQGVRQIKANKFLHESLVRMYSFLFSTILAKGKLVKDASNGLRGFKLSLFNSQNSINLNQDWLNRYELEPYMLYKILSNRNIKYAEIPIEIVYHKTRSKMKLKNVFRLLKVPFLLKLRIKK